MLHDGRLSRWTVSGRACCGRFLDADGDRLEKALRLQPSSEALRRPICRAIAVGFWVLGNFLHYYSMYALGWKYVYHGDCFFGPQRFVTAFPYGYLPSPMYNGKAISYLGSALWTGKPAGLFLAAWTFVVFNITGIYEDKVTEELYKDQIESSDVGLKGEKAE